MTRSRTLTAVLAMLAFILVGAGCGGGGGSGGKGLINTFKSLTGQSDQLIATVPHAATSSELAALKAKLNQISTKLTAAPDNLSSEEIAARDTALAARLRLETAIRQAEVQAEAQAQRNAEIPQTAAMLADSSRPPLVAPDNVDWITLRNDLKKRGEDYIKEFACEQAWVALTPEKKQEQTPPPNNWFGDASAQTVQGYIDTAYKDWKSTAVGQYVSWAQYGNGLFEKMEEFASQSRLAAPAQAYYYYARYCLTPPIP
jgi:hypothetical protein